MMAGLVGKFSLPSISKRTPARMLAMLTMELAQNFIPTFEIRTGNIITGEYRITNTIVKP